LLTLNKNQSVGSGSTAEVLPAREQIRGGQTHGQSIKSPPLGMINPTTQGTKNTEYATAGFTFADALLFVVLQQIREGRHHDRESGPPSSPTRTRLVRDIDYYNFRNNFGRMLFQRPLTSAGRLFAPRSQCCLKTTHRGTPHFHFFPNYPDDRRDRIPATAPSSASTSRVGGGKRPRDIPG